MNKLFILFESNLFWKIKWSHTHTQTSHLVLLFILDFYFNLFTWSCHDKFISLNVSWFVCSCECLISICLSREVGGEKPVTLVAVKKLLERILKRPFLFIYLFFVMVEESLKCLKTLFWTIPKIFKIFFHCLLHWSYLFNSANLLDSFLNYFLNFEPTNIAHKYSICGFSLESRKQHHGKIVPSLWISYARRNLWLSFQWQVKSLHLFEAINNFRLVFPTSFILVIFYHYYSNKQL